jgi:hypothetical protein
MSNYTKSTNFATKDNLTPGDPLKIVRGTEIDTEFNNIATAIATKTDNASAAVTGGTINDTTIGATTASTGAFTTLAASGNVTLSGGTANGVAYLNGSKVVTSGSALTFDGTGFQLSTSTGGNFYLNSTTTGTSNQIVSLLNNGNAYGNLNYKAFDHIWSYGASEQMRLTSTGLGIGTSSPSTKLTVHAGADGDVGFFRGGSIRQLQIGTSSTAGYINTDNGSAGLEIRTNGTARMYVDNSGNLGLGVTPSGWGSGQKAIQIGATGALYTPADRYLSLGSNFYDNGTNGIYLTTGHATNYQQNRTSGVHAWYNAPSGTAGDAITFTQAMTLTAGGNLGVGNTSPDSRLVVEGSSGTYAQIKDGTVNTFIQARSADSVGVVGTITNHGLAFYTNSTEKARIDSSGNLLVGTTSADPIGAKVQGTCITGNGNQVNAMANGTRAGAFGRYTSTGALIDLFYYGGSLTSVGSISTDGTNTTYGTSSDYRLKNTISPMTGALAKVAQLKPVTYKWNADGSDGQGFIAHELAEVVPQAVTGEKDAVDDEGNPKYQGIDTSFLVATLTAAIQEQQAIIESLKARLDAANL